MAKKYKVSCLSCEKEDQFEDEKAITYAHWKIIAWKLPDNSPLCVCNKCDYPIKKK